MYGCGHRDPCTYEVALRDRAGTRVIPECITRKIQDFGCTCGRWYNHSYMGPIVIPECFSREIRGLEGGCFSWRLTQRTRVEQQQRRSFSLFFEAIVHRWLMVSAKPLGWYLISPRFALLPV